MSRPDLSHLPVADGEHWWVYEHVRADGVVTYVGCSMNPRARQTSHSAFKFRDVAEVRIAARYDDRDVALRAEARRIAELQPRGNRAWTMRYYDAWGGFLPGVYDGLDLAEIKALSDEHHPQSHYTSRPTLADYEQYRRTRINQERLAQRASA